MIKVAFFLSVLAAPFTGGADLTDALDVLRAVGPEGRGSQAAAVAWQTVSKAQASALPEILEALNGASALSANWIRAALDTICERELSRRGKLPAKGLEAFILDTRNDPRGRRLAYEWLAKFDPTLPERILPRLGDDPSVEFRRDAVSRILEGVSKLGKGKEEEAIREYRRALGLARDDDQVKRIAKALEGLGQPVDLAHHFGFLKRWDLVGPFEHTGSKAFHVAYEPERSLDLEASYTGKSETIRWSKAVTEHAYGIVDVNKQLGRHKGSIAYATAEFLTEEPQDIEIRLGCITAWKLWLNGEFLFGHEEYHHGMELDQFRVKAKLRKGRNRILLKVCQNEQTEDWAQDWKFQLRVCDGVGTAIHPAVGQAEKNSAGREKESGS